MSERVRCFQADRVLRPRGAPIFELSRVPAGMPLDIEVGCGVGFHPIRYARENRDRYLVAIEHTRMKFLKFAGRLEHHEKLSNLLAVHADAVAWITHFVPSASVDRYFFLYPNPNPKPRDENRRWYAMPFMAKVIETLKPGGSIRFATNERFYAEGARDFMTREWGLELASDQTLQGPDLPPGIPRTHFEKKYLERGETCFDLQFRRPG